MIIVDETKMDYGTLYNILTAMDLGDPYEEKYKCKYSDWWVKNKEAEYQSERYAALDEENKKKILDKAWDKNGETVDIVKFVDDNIWRLYLIEEDDLK